MDVRQIKMFRTVFQENSLSRAAKTLFISQQALSKQIGVLERELGAQLFERKNRGMVPTPLGTYLYEQTSQLVNEFDAVVARFEDAKQARTKEVTLCAEKGLLRNRPDVFPCIVQELRTLGDRSIELAVDDLDGDECRSAVARGDRDFALVVSSTGDDVGDRAIWIGDIEVNIGVRRENPVALCDRLDPEVIESLRVSLPNEVTRRWMEQVLKEYGCQSAPVFVEHARDTMNLDGFVLSHCDAIICWRSLLFACAQESLRFYPLGRVGLYLLRSPFFFDDGSAAVIHRIIGTQLSLF